MCGVIYLGDRRVEIPCLVLDPLWWRHPWPPIDFTQIGLGEDTAGPLPEPWKVELTKLGEMLAAAGRFRDDGQAGRLGAVIVEVGNAIAEQERAEVRFEWAAHVR